MLRHKFHAKPTTVDEKRFDSKLEARYYNNLKIRQKSREILFFLRQVSFELPGGVRYVCDFQVFFADGSVCFVDTKGKDTQMSINKRKQVEEIYPIKIEIVNRC